MAQPKVGDTVRFLNAVGGGTVSRIEGNIAYVTDSDGFDTPVMLREIVAVGPTNPISDAPMRQGARPQPQPSPATKADPSVIPEAPAAKPEPAPDVEEVEGNDLLNITLAYEPTDIKLLSRTTYDTYLVNDSNYYLAFTYSSADDSGAYTLRRSGVVEPNIQLLLEELTADALPAMSRIAFQAVAWKEGKPYEVKRPVNVDLRFDATRLCKLHCFKPNTYFDKPVVAYALVSDDKPLGRMPEPDPEELRRAMTAKERKQPVKKSRPADRPRRNDIIEVDLHIDELVDTTAGLSPADMLNLQVDEFRRVMDANLGRHGQRIVFIHGKGEGVLREALMKEMRHRYKTCRVQDASFREYGFGATQVTIA